MRIKKNGDFLPLTLFLDEIWVKNRSISVEMTLCINIKNDIIQQKLSDLLDAV